MFGVASNRRVAIPSRNEHDSTEKDSEYVFDVAPSEMNNHSDTHVLEGLLESNLQRLKGALFHISLKKYS